MPVFQVEFTLMAGHQISDVPGLRQRVEETLTGILETAEEIRRAHGFRFGLSPEDPLRVHVGGYLVSYSLDLDQQLAKVLLMERAKREPVPRSR
jgi:hypothetical protein